MVLLERPKLLAPGRPRIDLQGRSRNGVLDEYLLASLKKLREVAMGLSGAQKAVQHENLQEGHRRKRERENPLARVSKLRLRPVLRLVIDNTSATT